MIDGAVLSHINFLSIIDHKNIYFYCLCVYSTDMSKNVTLTISSCSSENVLCHLPPNHRGKAPQHHWASRRSQAPLSPLAQAPASQATLCPVVRSCWSNSRPWRTLSPANERRSLRSKREPAPHLFASLPACLRGLVSRRNSKGCGMRQPPPAPRRLQRTNRNVVRFMYKDCCVRERMPPKPSSTPPHPSRGGLAPLYIRVCSRVPDLSTRWVFECHSCSLPHQHARDGVWAFSEGGMSQEWLVDLRGHRED